MSSTRVLRVVSAYERTPFSLYAVTPARRGGGVLHIVGTETPALSRHRRSDTQTTQTTTVSPFINYTYMSVL